MYGILFIKYICTYIKELSLLFYLHIITLLLVTLTFELYNHDKGRTETLNKCIMYTQITNDKNDSNLLMFRRTKFAVMMSSHKLIITSWET